MPVPICTSLNLESPVIVLIKFYVLERKPSIFSSQIFLNKSKLYMR